METKQNVPKLRFPEFTDAWEQRKLEDMCYLITKQTGFDYSETIKPSLVTEYSNDVYSFIQNKDFEGENINLDTDFYIPKEVADRFPKITLDTPSLLISISGKIGNVGYYRLKNKAFIGGAVGICKLKEDNGRLLVYALQSDKGQAYFHSLVKASSHANITVEDIRKIEVFLPKSNEEYKMLEDFFYQLDKAITLHQRKCDELKKLKKGMLQKMFPKDGENVPEIRFPGFDEAWEQRKLSELCVLFTDGDWIESKDQSESGIRLVQTGNVGTTEYLDKPNNRKWISEETFNRLHCEEIFAGDILISRLPEPAGRACIMPDIGTRMITAVDCTIVRTTEDYDSKFLVQYLSTPMYFKTVNAFLGGGTRQRISRGNLAEIAVPVPSSKEEQCKIGVFFKALDDTITLHQRKCDELKEMKKGLLQQMFV